jgi:transaldolase
MKYLFADTANLEEIKFLDGLSLIQGVTTNPSIVAKEPKQNFELLIDKLWDYCSHRNLPLSVEVFSNQADEITRQALEIRDRLLKINDRIDLLYVKVPIGRSEIAAIKALPLQGINVNCTCCYTAEQMMLAVLSGAKYVSIFYNRLKDIGGDPLRDISLVRQFIDDNKSSAKIITGSVRKPADLGDAWGAGSDIITCSQKIIMDSLHHDKSVESADQFLSDFSNWVS